MKNFAGQGDSMLTVLTANELTTEVAPAENIFERRPLFIDNCKNCNMQNFANVDGAEGNTTFENILDFTKVGLGIWSDRQSQISAREQAELALQIERQKILQEQLKTEREQAKADSMAGRIKAYGIPLAIGGVVVIGGIAAYFYFKKK